MEEILRKMLEGKASSCAAIPVEKIEFAQYVADGCKLNQCGRYGKSWMCPPGAGDWEALRDKYRKFSSAFVFNTVTPLEDSFDVEGMDAALTRHLKITDEAYAELKKQGVNIAVLGAGSCARCGACTYPNAPCRLPELAYPSVEATGIDVVKLAKDCGLRYHGGPNTVTYFSVIFYH